LFNKIEVSLLNKKFFCSSFFGLCKTKKINNEPKINTNKKIKIKIPLFGSLAKVCTEFKIPDLTKKVPHILNVNVAMDNIIVQDLSISLFSKTVIVCNKAVKHSHSISDTFSTGSQNQKPPQPSS